MLPRMMKRNDVVLVGPIDMHNFYGRINRMIDDQFAEVIYCGRNWGVKRIVDLKVDDYKGYIEDGRYHRMPTLRKLKQMAARYDKRVWKRRRNDPTLTVYENTIIPRN